MNSNHIQSHFRCSHKTFSVKSYDAYVVTAFLQTLPLMSCLAYSRVEFGRVLKTNFELNFVWNNKKCLECNPREAKYGIWLLWADRNHSKLKVLQSRIFTEIGMLMLPKKSSCDPCRADWQTCLKNRPSPRTPRTSFNRETASNTQLSSSWSLIEVNRKNWFKLKCASTKINSPNVEMQLVVVDVIDIAENRIEISSAVNWLWALSDLQFKLFIPFRTKRVRFNGSGFDDFRRHWTHRVAMLTLSLEAQPEATVFT